MQCTIREIVTPHEREKAHIFLHGQGLAMPHPVEYGVAAYRGDVLIGTGFRGGDILMGLCVAPACRGEGISVSITGELVRQAVEWGKDRLFIFTKPSEAPLFSGLGFSLVATVPGHAALLEWGVSGFADWLSGIVPAVSAPEPVGAVVLNANPFTRGHRYLLETAARYCQTVYAFVVETDCSAFPFADRLSLVRQGMADITQCRVLPGGPYIISLATFPSYFSGVEGHAANHAALDLHVFGQRIAPAFNIRTRFVGTEPISAVTAIYNAAMRDILPSYAIAIREMARLQNGSDVISASMVRARLAEGNLDTALGLVPPRDGGLSLFPEISART